MITPEQIEQKAQRKWSSFLRAWLEQQAFFPLRYPVGRLPMENFEQLAAKTKILLDQSKHHRGIGYTLQMETRNTKAYGKQSLPRQIIIETADDYLALTRRKGKFEHFKALIHLTRTQMPELEDWLRQHPKAVLRFADAWANLLLVCQYFCSNPRPNLYARELPIPVHTKFIEQHRGILRALLDVLLPQEAVDRSDPHFERRFGLRYDEPLIRLRLLHSDDVNRLALPFTDLSIPVSQMAVWQDAPQHCLIVENKLTFLTLPQLPNTLALWGGGFRVGLLTRIDWLKSRRLLYWGDLDAQGFQILAQLRSIFPHVLSVMMDITTLERFSSFVVSGTPTPISMLPNLSAAELELYKHLQQYTLRLEQEHIAPEYTQAHLQSLFT